MKKHLLKLFLFLGILCNLNNVLCMEDEEPRFHNLFNEFESSDMEVGYEEEPTDEIHALQSNIQHICSCTISCTNTYPGHSCFETLHECKISQHFFDFLKTIHPNQINDFSNPTSQTVLDMALEETSKHRHDLSIHHCRGYRACEALISKGALRKKDLELLANHPERYAPDDKPADHLFFNILNGGRCKQASANYYRKVKALFPLFPFLGTEADYKAIVKNLRTI